MILAGQGGGMLKTGRYLRYAENQQVGPTAFGVDAKVWGGNRLLCQDHLSRFRDWMASELSSTKNVPSRVGQGDRKPDHCARPFANVRQPR